MPKSELSNALHVGGTLENALSGNYKLSASRVIQEAFSLTQHNFWRFVPASLVLITVNVLIFFAILAFLIGSPSLFFDAFIGKEQMSPELFSSGQIAMLASTVLSSPIYAGASMMGLSHAIGFETKPRHIIKGLTFGIAVIIAVCCISLIERVANEIIPILGLFFSVAFSMTILLICEKKLKPVEAIFISFRASTKKMLPLCLIYLAIMLAFIVSYVTAGLALIWALPFMFNVKGILYREMFGVGIEITISEEGDDDSSSDNNNKEVFNA